MDEERQSATEHAGRALLTTGTARAGRQGAAGGTPGAVASSPMARWFRVLEAFAQQPEWGIRDLAARAGLSRSAVHRIVHEMSDLGLLMPSVSPGRSQAGPALTRLAVALGERIDVLRVARPVLADLRDETTETAILCLYDAARRRFRAVAAAESVHPIRYLWDSLEDWSEVHLGASGKGILAFLPGDEQQRILAGLPDPLPGPRRVGREELRAELDAARQLGYVVSHGERFSGAVGVSAPIRDAAGRVIGDVLLGWPDNRTDANKEARVGLAAIRAASRISGALGHRAA